MSGRSEMVKVKLYLVIVTLSLVALLVGACTGQPGPTPELEVRDAAEARDTAISYLRAHVGENAPAADIEWDAENVTPPGLIGQGTTAFTSDEWTITVSYPVVPPENAVYEVVVSSIKLGWHWKGTIEPDANVTELSAFRQMSEEESQRIAEAFVRNSPTFAFDGISDTLRLTNTLNGAVPSMLGIHF